MARDFGFHPISVAELQNGASTLIKWFLPSSSTLGLDTIPPLFRIAIFGIITLIGILIFWQVKRLVRQNNYAGSRSLVGILLLTIPFYVGFLIVTLSFFDDGSRLGDRLLLPINIAMLLLSVYALYTLIKYSDRAVL